MSGIVKTKTILVLAAILLLALLNPTPISANRTASANIELASTTNITNSQSSRIFLPILQQGNKQPSLHPNDPYYTNQWALETTNAPQAWKHAHGNNILIAVLDSGIDLKHPDLSNKVRDDIDKDFVNDDNEAQDDYGHGSHVAGIAAAATNNGEGIVGLGWDAEILPLKVLNNRGDGSLADIIDAILYATDQGARIINMSFSTNTRHNLQCSQFPELVSALKYAYDKGVLLIAAAGNNSDDASKAIPANCPYVLTVAATNADDAAAFFSNYGEVIDIAAPGVNIYSTYLNNEYRTKSGTSMAAPLVAGLAALIWQQHPTYTPDQVANAILHNATDLGDTGYDPVYGCGRIDAANAVINGAQQTTQPCKTNILQPPSTLLTTLSTIDNQLNPKDYIVSGQ
jgi:type VII secretion-associated serine protease mycosin